MRRFVPLLMIAALAACPSYDRYSYVTSEKGLMKPDDYARYGSEQAISVAVGREFGKGFSGKQGADFTRQADAALSYAKKFPEITSISADTLGHRLVLTFADGWRSQVTPITDGKRGDETVNLKH